MRSPWSLSQLIDAIGHNDVSSALIGQTRISSVDRFGEVHTTAIFPLQIDRLVDMMSRHRVEFAIDVPSGLEVAWPWFMLAAIVLSIMRGRAGIASLQRTLGHGRETGFEEADTKTTFADVAGSPELKRELSELVEFLKAPERFVAVGARIPRGVLMEGPPGTGKTLLARAVAGEAGVPFYATSGSDFVELYVGLGAMRVRELFRRARDRAPAILFIDEIDAVGKRRSGGANTAGNDEREQTLNAILSEMDGFNTDATVVVIACTNRLDSLDPALLRPGRFDRRVTVGLPDAEVRAQIARVHSADKPMSNDVNFAEVGRLTAGLSGADIAAVFNEAAISAARCNHTTICAHDIDDAIDKLTLGPVIERDVAANTRRVVAVHEAGHALVGSLTSAFDDELRKVTVRPRSNGVGGLTHFLPAKGREDGGLHSRSYLEARLDVLLGGRVAEEIVFGEAESTTGAASDLARARDLAQRMVADWGFYDEPASAEDVGIAAATLMQDSFARVRALLRSKLGALNRIAEELEVRDSIDGERVARLILANDATQKK